MQIYAIGRVINDVCQYFFDGDSYFAVFNTYKKEYMIFPQNFMVALCEFSFQKNLVKGRTKIFFVKKYGLNVCKRSALKKLNKRKQLEIQII